MLADVHGVFDRSMSKATLPRFVSMVTVCVPTAGTVVGGMPTFLMPLGSLGCGLALGSTSGVHEQGAVLAACAEGVADAPVAVFLSSSPATATMTHTRATVSSTPPATRPIWVRWRRLRR